MDDSMEKLLKELLQKKLHGTLTKDEETILNDLVMRKKGGGSLAKDMSTELPPLQMNKLLGDIDNLKSSFDEMAGKIGMRGGTADARQRLAEEEKKSKDKK